ncbi:MAG: hypothetical protein IM618_11115 [Cytophagales bacterium]|nr:hypothetical protein [Cytophagales bacterium]
MKAKECKEIVEVAEKVLILFGESKINREQACAVFYSFSWAGPSAWVSRVIDSDEKSVAYAEELLGPQWAVTVDLFLDRATVYNYKDVILIMMEAVSMMEDIEEKGNKIMFEGMF